MYIYLGVGLECAVELLKAMKIQPDFCVLVLLLFYHQERASTQLTVDILQFKDNQLTLDNASVLATYSFPTGFSNPFDWFVEPYANIPSDGGVVGLLHHPIPHNACTPILESQQRDCASICNASSTNISSRSPFQTLMGGRLFNLSRIALVGDYHVCTGKKLEHTQMAGFDGLITFTGDSENRNVNNRVYDNTAKTNVDVAATQFPVAVVNKLFAQTLIQNATYECTSQSECDNQWQSAATVVRVKGDSTRQGWIQVGIGISLVVVVIGVPLITCIMVCICCVWCCTLCRSRKRNDDDDEDDDVMSYGCCERYRDYCVQSCEKCKKSDVYEVYELQHQTLGPDDELARPVRSTVRQSSRREEFLREREQSLHNLRRNEVESEANSQFRRKYETSMFDKREYTESEKAKESSKTCTICLCEFEVGESVCALPCDDSHIFHTKCIEQWLETNSVCPVCRTFIAMPNH